MRKYLMASAMIMALAAPAVAQTAPAGGVAGTTSANPLAEARSFNEDTGASIFGGWSQGEFGSMVPALADGVTRGNVPDNGTFGTDRAVWAPLGSDPLFAGAIAERRGSNSTDNLQWLNTQNGVSTGNALLSNPNPCTLLCN